MSQQKERPRRLVAMQNPRMDDRAAQARAAKRKGKELTRPQGRKPREMTIGFKTHFPKRMGGGPTHFVEKISEGIRDPNDNSEILFYSDNGKRFDPYSAYAPKIHTIREDPHDRWKVGMKVHPVINNRTPQRFQFAPILECKSTQKIEIEWVSKNPIVVIDSVHFYNPLVGIDRGVKALSINDGFESVEQFFQWFNEPFVGKLIHWTDFKY